MNHHATPDVWRLYNALPGEVQELADENYALLRADPTHPSLRFREIEGLWSARVGAHYRALAYRQDGSFVWFWIGSHADYDKLMP